MLTPLALTAALPLSGAPAQSAATKPPARSAVTKPLTFRGMTVRIPRDWTVKKVGDSGLRVRTGPCSSHAAECPGFLLLGPKGIRWAYEGRSFEPDYPYHPSTGVQLCVPDKRYYEVTPQRPSVKGTRQIGAGHRASYRLWKVRCVTRVFKPSEPQVRYTQRTWYLPSSKILIVDQWSTPGLGGLLRRASWR